MDEHAYFEWIDAYSHRDNPEPACIHPQPAAHTEMPCIDSGLGDGVYTVYCLVRDGKLVGTVVRFIEPNEPYPFPIEKRTH